MRAVAESNFKCTVIPQEPPRAVTWDNAPMRSRSTRATDLALTVTLAVAPCVPAVAAAGAKDAPADAQALAAALRGGVAHVGYGSAAGESVELRWLGTGFLAGKRCTVVTAKHLLQDVPPDRLIVRFENPADPGSALTFHARATGSDPERDLTYLTLAELPGGGDPCAAGALRPLPLAEEIGPRGLAGADVLLLGFPALEGEQPREVPIVRRGSIASAELSWSGKPMLLLDLTGVPGFSGAPVVLSATGQVVGVVFGPGRTQREYDLEWATPITRRDLKHADLE